jgi:hypothetical protein
VGPSVPVAKIEPTVALTTKGLGGVTSVIETSFADQASSKIGVSGVAKSQSPKDQFIPTELNKCVEEFKKNLEDMRKIKDLNSIYTNKPMLRNGDEIINIKQLLAQSNTNIQRLGNEANKLKNLTSQVRIFSTFQTPSITYRLDLWVL